MINNENGIYDEKQWQQFSIEKGASLGDHWWLGQLLCDAHLFYYYGLLEMQVLDSSLWATPPGDYPHPLITPPPPRLTTPGAQQRPDRSIAVRRLSQPK